MKIKFVKNDLKIQNNFTKKIDRLSAKVRRNISLTNELQNHRINFS